MVKKSFAPPVTNFSISCDPSMVTWLNEYAYKHRTSRSRIVRKALIDFRAEHKDAPSDRTAPIVDPRVVCWCGALILTVPGVRPMCTVDPNHDQKIHPKGSLHRSRGISE